MCNREGWLCWLSPAPRQVSEQVLSRNASELDGRLRLEANWLNFAGLALRRWDYLFGLRTKMFVVATFRNPYNELLVDTIEGVDGTPLMVYGPNRRHLLIAFKRTSGEIELRLFITDGRYLAQRFEIDCQGGRRQRLEISNLSFNPNAPTLKFDLQADCISGTPTVAGKLVHGASSNETIEVQLTQDFYVLGVRTLSAETEEAARNANLEAGKARFLECASTRAAEFRALYQGMGVGTLYCWTWEYLGLPGPSPGSITYRALSVTQKSVQALDRNNCPATRPEDFFVAGTLNGADVAIAPNTDYAIVGCRTYSSVSRPSYDSDRRNVSTYWHLTLSFMDRTKKILIRCRCDEIQIDRAIFDKATDRLLLSLTIEGNEYSIEGKTIKVAGPGKFAAVRTQVAIAFDRSLEIRSVQSLPE